MLNLRKKTQAVEHSCKSFKSKSKRNIVQKNETGLTNDIAVKILKDFGTKLRDRSAQEKGKVKYINRETDKEKVLEGEEVALNDTTYSNVCLAVGKKSKEKLERKKIPGTIGALDEEVDEKEKIEDHDASSLTKKVKKSKTKRSGASDDQAKSALNVDPVKNGFCFEAKNAELWKKKRNE